MNAEKLTTKERNEIKAAQANYKKNKKNRVSFQSFRDDVIRKVVGTRAPNWGSINFVVTKHGI